MIISKLATAAAVAALMLPALPAAAHDIVYTGSLSGLAESPPNGSAGTGFTTITFDDHNFTMRVEATFSGLTGNITASHIHCCTANPGAATAGVATQLPSFGGFPLGVTSGSYDQTFDMTQLSSWNSAFVGANGGTTGAAFSTLLQGFADGKAYLNIHTTAVGSGEIRAFPQLAPVPEPETWALMAAGLGGVAWRVKRRKVQEA
ncbi:hypothetical protein BH11PSE8_BH11PSE8_31900 [soil metagenome]